MKDDLGNRMKEYYEHRSRTYLTRRLPVIIRCDGKAFHTFCKRFEKPYDEFLNESLNGVMQYLCQNIQGVKFAERHSDEISLLLTDYDTHETDCWYDYNVQKMCSVSASMATAEFCRRLMLGNFLTGATTGSMGKALDIHEPWPNFDARCFNIPEAEIANYHWWRMLDAKRSSINMVAQCNFSHKSLQGLSCNEMQEKLWQEKQINWAKLPQGQKIGFTCTREKAMKTIPGGPMKGELVERNSWVVKGSPSSKTELDGLINSIKFVKEKD
jgi:tRNA(His) guanylyltransferase